MQTQAPKGQYRVLGLDPVDTLTWPSGPLWKDCETLDDARDLADRNEDSYAWVYIFDDTGEALYEGGCHKQQLGSIRLDDETSGGTKPKP